MACRNGTGHTSMYDNNAICFAKFVCIHPQSKYFIQFLWFLVFSITISSLEKHEKVTQHPIIYFCKLQFGDWSSNQKTVGSTIPIHNTKSASHRTMNSTSEFVHVLWECRLVGENGILITYLPTSKAWIEMLFIQSRGSPALGLSTLCRSPWVPHQLQGPHHSFPKPTASHFSPTLFTEPLNHLVQAPRISQQNLGRLRVRTCNPKLRHETLQWVPWFTFLSVLIDILLVFLAPPLCVFIELGIWRSSSRVGAFGGMYVLTASGGWMPSRLECLAWLMFLRCVAWFQILGFDWYLISSPLCVRCNLGPPLPLQWDHIEGGVFTSAEVACQVVSRVCSLIPYLLECVSVCIELWGSPLRRNLITLDGLGHSFPHLHFCMRFVKLELVVSLGFWLVPFRGLGKLFAHCSPLIAVCGLELH